MVLTLAVVLFVWAASSGTFFLNSPGTTPSAHERTQATGGVDWLNVSVNDQLRFTVSSQPSGPAEISPGATVHVEVTQLGNIAHTFTLSPTAGFAFPSSDQTSDLLTYFHAHPPIISLNVSPTQGSEVFGNFTAPSYGQYEYVCEIPGHFSAGMYGFLGSGEPGQGAGSAPYNGPGAPVFIITGIITGLVIIAIVLGFVIGKRRGSSEEMPPERLGYPEPPVRPQ